jgi:CHAD domain-containing protein
VARPRQVPGLDCDEPFELAAARVLEVRAAEVFEHSAGVLGIEDIEPLHDMRVATRRLRAALEVFRPCFPKKRYKAAMTPLKGLADALGERRDRDVAIEFLHGFLEEAPAGDRGRLEILVARLRDEQRLASEALAPFVTEPSLARLRAALAELDTGAVRP